MRPSALEKWRRSRNPPRRPDAAKPRNTRTPPVAAGPCTARSRRAWPRCGCSPAPAECSLTQGRRPPQCRAPARATRPLPVACPWRSPHRLYWLPYCRSHSRSIHQTEEPGRMAPQRVVTVRNHTGEHAATANRNKLTPPCGPVATRIVAFMGKAAKRFLKNYFIKRM